MPSLPPVQPFKHSSCDGLGGLRVREERSSRADRGTRQLPAGILISCPLAARWAGSPLCWQNAALSWAFFSIQTSQV